MSNEISKITMTLEFERSSNGVPHNLLNRSTLRLALRRAISGVRFGYEEYYTLVVADAVGVVTDVTKQPTFKETILGNEK